METIYTGCTITEFIALIKEQYDKASDRELIKIRVNGLPSFKLVKDTDYSSNVSEPTDILNINYVQLD